MKKKKRAANPTKIINVLDLKHINRELECFGIFKLKPQESGNIVIG